MIFINSLNTDDVTFVEKLFHDYAPIMYKAANKILLDNCLAEDAVQMAFENIIKYLPRIKNISEDRLAAYLTVVCKNAAFEVYNERFPCNARVDFVEVIQDERFDPQRICFENEKVQYLINLIQSLKPIYSDALMLKYYCELDEDIVADSLGISIYTLRKRITRGKNMLMELLEKDENF